MVETWIEGFRNFGTIEWLKWEVWNGGVMEWWSRILGEL
jgi:hypothetical protein